jgi:hypothetical protein
MKRITALILVLGFIFTGCLAEAYARGSSGSHSSSKSYSSKSYSKSGTTSVHGYFRKNGTYVQPHMRTSPNNTKMDNWSTKGNVNPYTGKAGTKSPY